MSSRTATVLVILIIAIMAFCLACVCASMTGQISILPQESESGGILDNLSAITEDSGDTVNSYGNPDYDIACFYFFCHYFQPFVTERIFHCDAKFLHTMWNSFIKYYYETNDQKVLDEITKKFEKYGLVCFFGLFKFIDPGVEIKEIMDQYFDKVFA